MYEILVWDLEKEGYKRARGTFALTGKQKKVNQGKIATIQ